MSGKGRHTGLDFVANASACREQSIAADRFDTMLDDLQREFCALAETLRTVEEQLRGTVPRFERSLNLPPKPSAADERAAPLLSVFLLGRFRAFVGEDPVVDWHGTRSRELFKFLVCQRHHRAPKERLMAALWPEGSSSASANSLRVTMHALRRTLLASTDRPLTESVISFDDDFYFFNPAVRIWVDADEFEHAWRTGCAYARAGDAEAAKRELQKAARLYAGDFLEDEQYQEWALLQREHLKDLQLNVLDRLQRYCPEENGEDGCLARCARMLDPDGCIVRCQQILALDPCRESAYRWLIRCHAKLGQLGRARRWYETCITVLDRELDQAPSRETRDVYRRLAADYSAAD